jgi:hypothetical protein
VICLTEVPELSGRFPSLAEHCGITILFDYSNTLSTSSHKLDVRLSNSIGRYQCVCSLYGGKSRLGIYSRLQMVSHVVCPHRIRSVITSRRKLDLWIPQRTDVVPPCVIERDGTSVSKVLHEACRRAPRQGRNKGEIREGEIRGRSSFILHLEKELRPLIPVRSAVTSLTELSWNCCWASLQGQRTT